jgi:hypothetical protein
LIRSNDKGPLDLSPMAATNNPGKLDREPWVFLERTEKLKVEELLNLVSGCSSLRLVTSVTAFSAS